MTRCLRVPCNIVLRHEQHFGEFCCSKSVSDLDDRLATLTVSSFDLNSTLKFGLCWWIIQRTDRAATWTSSRFGWRARLSGLTFTSFWSSLSIRTRHLFLWRRVPTISPRHPLRAFAVCSPCSTTLLESESSEVPFVSDGCYPAPYVLFNVPLLFQRWFHGECDFILLLCPLVQLGFRSLGRHGGREGADDTCPGSMTRVLDPTANLTTTTKDDD